MIGLSAGHFGDPIKCKRKHKNAFCTSWDPPPPCPRPLSTASMESILIPQGVDSKGEAQAPDTPY